MPGTFTSPPARQLFYQRVWDLVRQIPAGQVATYGQIAAMLPPPEGVTASAYRAHGPRWVGGAMAQCPPDVPWHRVVNAQGRISPRAGEGPRRQRQRLQAEGIAFDASGRIDLARYRWSPERRGPLQGW